MCESGQGLTRDRGRVSGSPRGPGLNLRGYRNGLSCVVKLTFVLRSRSKRKTAFFFVRILSKLVRGGFHSKTEKHLQILHECPFTLGDVKLKDEGRMRWGAGVEGTFSPSAVSRTHARNVASCSLVAFASRPCSRARALVSVVIVRDYDCGLQCGWFVVLCVWG